MQTPPTKNTAPQSEKPLRQPSPEAIKIAAALLLKRHQRLNPPPRTDRLTAAELTAEKELAESELRLGKSSRP